MKYAIEINNLNKIYSPNKKNSSAISALSNVNLKIKKGSFFGLLGPNGAGKSTIINILSGLVNKTSGDVKICDLDIEHYKQLAKYKIGIVPQEITFDPFFTVYETLEIYAGYYGIKKSQRKTREIIQAMGLSDKSKSKPRNLSGGMKRRLLIAKSLVHSPEILVLDEPTAGVDVDLRNQLWDYVKKLNKSGTTILLTTHYLEEAEQLCDEIAVINKGKVIAHDKKDKLMNILSQKELIISVNNIAKLNLDISGTKINKISNDKFSINYDPNIISVETILSSLAKAKIAINDISTAQPDLEEIFKYLVKSS